MEYIKNPVVAEFMGFRKDTKFDESQLEQALIDNLQQFIMELGRGFAFVDRRNTSPPIPMISISTLCSITIV